MTEDPNTPTPASPAAPTAPASAPTDAPAPPSSQQVLLALRKVKDPELNLNIVDLGLVYDILVEDNSVVINMTLTSPGCPAGPEITTDVDLAVRRLPGVADVLINLVWEPYWTPDKIEPRVRAYMGL